MMMAIKSIAALVLLALTVPATAGTVTVHNQGHYLAAFQVSDQDSGVFPIGQSRTMENVSGTLTIKYRGVFAWFSFSTLDFNDPTLFNVKADSTIEVTFLGDIFNPKIKINNLYCKAHPDEYWQCSYDDN